MSDVKKPQSDAQAQQSAARKSRRAEHRAQVSAAKSAQMASVQAAVHVANRLRDGTPPSAAHLALADPVTLQAELAVISASLPPAPVPSDTVRAIRTALDQQPEHRISTGGRPSDYSDSEAEHLLQWIQAGKSLSQWCRSMRRQPATIYGWMRSRPSFMQAYARAHEDRADTLVDEMVALADSLPDGAPLELVQVRKLQIETRRWLAERLRPKRYGLQQDGRTSPSVSFQINLPAPQPDAQPATVLTVPMLPDEG